MKAYLQRYLCAFALLSVGSAAMAAAPKAVRYDLVVYSATPSGIMAAVTAARGGLHVALLERTAHVGGIVTNGLSYTDKGEVDTIGGVPNEFFVRVGKEYHEQVEYGFEPHIAEQVLNDMLREAHVEVFLNSRLRERDGVRKKDTRIAEIVTEGGRVFAGLEFVDCSYDGDLMNQTGVANTWGREPAAEYKESKAGVLPSQRKDLQFRVKVSPYRADGSLLPGISSAPKGAFGDGDKKVPAYNFRFCLSKDKANQAPYPKPDGYDPAQYELLARYLHALQAARGSELHLGDMFLIGPLQNQKADFNNMGAFSTDDIGVNWDYPTANYKRKEEIAQEVQRYDAGLLYFVAHDPQVPATLQREMNEWGMAKDEFTDMNNWPRQMYVRESRRMLGEYVFTQHDVLDDSKKEDSVGMGSYQLDSHNVQRVVSPDGGVENEGDMFVNNKPYEVPYRSIVPKRAEATNLLVPVCVSASHAAYGTIRQEAVYMILGQAAGDAAMIAIRDRVDVQDVSVPKLQKQLIAEHVVLHQPS